MVFLPEIVDKKKTKCKSFDLLIEIAVLCSPNLQFTFT